MSDLIFRSQRVLQALSDHSLIKPVRIEQATSCFDGLMLSDLREDVRTQLTENLAQTIAITSAYVFQEQDGIELLSDEDQDRYQKIVSRAALQAIQAECQRLIDELGVSKHRLPVTAIQEIREHRKLMIPALIAALETATQAVRDNREVNHTALFAFLLLGEFKAIEGRTAIINALSLPDRGPYTLFGDAATEDSARVLVAVLDNAFEELEPLLLNEQVDEFARWTIMNVFHALVATEQLSRAQAMERLLGYLRLAKQNNDCGLANAAVQCLVELAPREALDEIQGAFRLGLMDESMITFREVKKAAQASDEEVMEQLKLYAPRAIEDCLAELKNWHCFAEPTPRKPQATRITTAQPMPSANLPSANLPSANLPSANLPSPHLNTANKESPTPVMALKRVEAPGRNDQCPCGSGKKYKKCCSLKD